ncbi:MAG: Mur ligase family protein [Tepidiformaceae bacterium]
MPLRTAAAVTAGKGVALASRLLGRGGGTALPGLVAERLDPAIVANLGEQLGRGRVLVTGTNGKTTTSRIVARSLEEGGIHYLHNREGSNLMRGIASALLDASWLSGTIPGGEETLGLFETDEATLPAAARALQPTALAFTNLFRDQLDRYGEVDTVAGFWRTALQASPRDATLVLNADDPSVADLAIGWEGPVHWFGVDDPAFATETAGATDARWCGACGGSFAYTRRYFAHIGHWRCTGCERVRAEPQTSGSNIRLGLDAAAFDVTGLGTVTMPLTGVYNVYNALAGVAILKVLDVPEAPIVAGLANVRPAFGRQEVVELEGRRLRIMLCKNPAGANQVIRLLRAVDGGAGLHVAALLNDRFADGRDVSWTWDVDFELLAGRIASCYAGGDRAEDMALRLKYAGWPTPQNVARGPAQLLDAIVRGTPVGADVFVIPTYTAMLGLRAELAKRGVAGQFWK